MKSFTTCIRFCTTARCTKRWRRARREATGWHSRARGTQGLHGTFRCSGQATPPRSSGRSGEDLARALELHERQRTEAEPVLSLIKEWLGSRGARADAVLATLVPERFDAGPLLRQIDDVPPGPRNALVEGLEHLHTILISEQRDALRAALRLDPGAASPSASSPGTDKPSGDAS